MRKTAMSIPQLKRKSPLEEIGGEPLRSSEFAQEPLEPDIRDKQTAQR